MYLRRKGHSVRAAGLTGFSRAALRSGQALTPARPAVARSAGTSGQDGRLGTDEDLRSLGRVDERRYSP